MTRKDKIKELVGRSLTSYHTKALNQIDRIEQKNKEQSHKISVLTSKLDVTSNESPQIVRDIKLNKSEISNNTNDINDNIIPYLMDMDFRVICLQLEGELENFSMSRLFGGTYQMLQRDILSKRYSKEEYLYRLNAYLNTKKISKEEYIKLGDMLNE